MRSSELKYWIHWDFRFEDEIWAAFEKGGFEKGGFEKGGFEKEDLKRQTRTCTV